MNNQNKNIDLKFQQTISVVSGRPKGIECYETQIKNIVENDLNITELKFTIVFPDNIQLVSGSYLLGMFETINNIIGIEGIKERFEFKSNTGDDLLQMLLDELKRSGC